MTDTIKESLNQNASGTTGEVVGNTSNETASDNSNASFVDDRIEKLDEGGTII